MADELSRREISKIKEGFEILENAICTMYSPHFFSYKYKINDTFSEDCLFLVIRFLRDYIKDARYLGILVKDRYLSRLDNILKYTKIHNREYVCYSQLSFDNTIQHTLNILSSNVHDRGMRTFIQEKVDFLLKEISLARYLGIFVKDEYIDQIDNIEMKSRRYIRNK